MLLLAFLVSCKTQSIAIPGEDSGQHLMSCNIENPGTDCKVNILITKVPLLGYYYRLIQRHTQTKTHLFIINITTESE